MYAVLSFNRPITDPTFTLVMTTKPTHHPRPTATAASTLSARNVALTAVRVLSPISILAGKPKGGRVRLYQFYPLSSSQRSHVAVFSLNEPDICGITPSQAASWYIEYINPLVGKSIVGATRVSADNNETAHQEGSPRRHFEHGVWPRPELALSNDRRLCWSVSI